MSQPPYSSSPQDYSSGGYGQQPSYGSSYGSPYGAQPAAPVAAGPPPSNAGWAVASILFFWPVAFAAFTHLHSIVPLWLAGDHQGAQMASDRVKSLGKIALWIWVGFFALFIIFYVVVIAAALSAASSGFN